MAGKLSAFTSFYIFFFLPYAILLIPAVNGDCSYSSCATGMGYPKDQIKFPFRAPDQPITCGLPGFDLGCNSSSRKPLIFFPSGQSVTVESIYYYSKGIRISDPQGCLPKKLLQISNTSGTPFWFKYFTRFSIYSCPSRAPLPYFNSLSSCSSINCGDGAPYSVLCGRNSSLLNDGCEFIGDTMVPGSWLYPYLFTIASYAYLNWDLPAACLRCSGVCHRSSKDTSKIKCNVFTPGVIAGITVATIVTIAFISCILCKCRKRMQSRTSNTVEGPGGTNNTDESRPNTTSSTNRQSNIASRALGRDTLDTYPIIMVGESGRMLSNMEDKTCPICLSDYAMKETLKLLPECLHKFHAECIDEWLCAKPTCPICRTPPPLRS